MRASLSTLVYDPLGHLELTLLASSSFGSDARRNNRIATLDGGAVFNDFGYTAADLDFTLRYRSRALLDERVRYLIRFYAELHLSCPRGAFRVIPGAFSIQHPTSALVLQVIEQRSA